MSGVASAQVLDFAAWVVSVAVQISEARGVSVEDLAVEPGELANQLARVRQHFVAMGPVKADAASWVNKTRAGAVQRARHDHGDYSASERKAIADADPDYVAAVRVRDDVKHTVAALNSMHYEILNDRRTSFNPQAHTNS